MRSAHKLYENAFQHFLSRHGTPYPCSQAVIDFHAFLELSIRGGPFMVAEDAAIELVRYNPLPRRVGNRGSRAIRNLRYIISWVADYGFVGPDLAIKAFQDLDTVFFAGRLSRKVVVCWTDSRELGAVRKSLFGVILTPAHYSGTAMIKLNATNIIL